MRTKLTLATILAVLLCGCASFETNSYKVLATTAYTVDAAMQGWGDYVRAGKADAADEILVETAYVRYQASMRVARSAMLSYVDGGVDKPTTEAALTALESCQADLVALIATLSK